MILPVQLELAYQSKDEQREQYDKQLEETRSNAMKLATAEAQRESNAMKLRSYMERESSIRQGDDHRSKIKPKFLSLLIRFHALCLCLPVSLRGQGARPGTHSSDDADPADGALLTEGDLARDGTWWRAKWHRYSQYLTDGQQRECVDDQSGRLELE